MNQRYRSAERRTIVQLYQGFPRSSPEYLSDKIILNFGQWPPATTWSTFLSEYRFDGALLPEIVMDRIGFPLAQKRNIPGANGRRGADLDGLIGTFSKKNTLDALAELVPQIQRCSVSEEPDLFDSKFLLLLRQYLHFDTAWIGKSTLAENGFILNSSCLYGLSHEYVDSWQRVRMLDSITPQVLASPGKAVVLSTVETGLHPEFSNFLKAYLIKETICVYFEDRSQNTCMHISLYRSDRTAQFTPRDVQLLEHVMQSFVFGSTVCALRRRLPTERLSRVIPEALQEQQTGFGSVNPQTKEVAGQEVSNGAGTQLPCSNAPLDGLTPKELQVSRLFAQGMTYKAIAKQLGMSPATVRHHLRSIYTKLSINNKTQIARLFGT